MKAKLLYSFSLMLVLIMIGWALNSVTVARKEAQAQVPVVTRIPFGGQIAAIEVCCDGIQFALTGQYQSPALGTFILPWINMTPNPIIGTGLFSWWSVIPSEKVLGSAIPGGTCQTIYSYCLATTPVAFTVMQMGTTLIPTI